MVLVVGMALGVLFGRRSISGSCAGMRVLGVGAECESCGGSPRLRQPPRG